MKKMAILQSIGPFAVGKRFSGLQAWVPKNWGIKQVTWFGPKAQRYLLYQDIKKHCLSQYPKPTMQYALKVRTAQHVLTIRTAQYALRFWTEQYAQIVLRSMP
jgi:hypothetical protein